MPDIDSLQIKINAEATKANDVIDKLCGKIDRLTTSMNKLDNVKIQNFSNSIKIFSDGMKNLQNIKTPDFNRVAKGLEKISSVNSDDVLKFGNALTPLANGINVLSTANFDSKNLQGLLNSVSKLSSANVGSLNNVDFAQLGNNINQLTSSIANAPKIQQSVISMTNAIGNLAKFGENIPIVSNSLGSLGTALNKLVSDMANSASISDSTINFANAIGLLAKSGNTMPTTISNLSALGIELKKLMAELSTAPKISQNLIDMTNALAKLARTGSSSGKAANSLVSSFNRISKASSGMKINLLSAVNGISAIRKSILQAIGIAGGFYAVFQGIKESINISSDLTEVQNVVDVTFGKMADKVEKLADISIEKFGMSEMTLKRTASIFQTMGVNMGIDPSLVEKSNEWLNKQTNGYVELGNSVADMSLNLTKLTADMESAYGEVLNVSFDDVADDLKSILTGTARPLRDYGLDLTETTIKEWAMKQGLDANIDSMSQAEKTMLRYQYVMANTKTAQGDFIRTADTWANQVRILKENFRELASVIGSSFINALKPLVRALNSAMGAIISFAKVVSNALGKIFGWQYEDTTGGIASDFEDAAEGADGLASGTGKAADNAKKLKQQLQGIDELNVLSSNNDTGTGGGSGGSGGASGGADESGGKWVKTDSIFENYESQLDTLYKLGEYIGDTLTDAMNSIDWDSVYQGARNFGSGLASFLNGLISPELFGATGRTIAGALNTAIYSALSFGETFDWQDLGNSIASGINEFFRTFDFKSLAKTLNAWVNGIATTISTALTNIDYKDVFSGFLSFFENLDISTITVSIGAILWMHGGKEIVAGALSGLLSKQIALGIGTATIPVSSAIGISFVVAIVGFWIGNKLYEKLSGEEAMGGISDLIDMDASMQEIGQAISEGAVTDITITPIIRAIAKDETITTDEVTSAMADMLDDIDYWLYDRLKEAWDFAWGKVKNNIGLGKDTIDIILSVSNMIKEKTTKFIVDLLKKGTDVTQKIIATITNDDENSLISWIFEKTRDISSKLTKDITTKLKNGDENGLISWIMTKIKNYPGSNLVKNITSTLQNGDANNLITWVMNKIKSGTNFSNVVKTSLTNASPKSIISWLLEKIMNNATISKTITATLSTKGADALEKVKGIWDRLTSKTISITFSDAFSEPIKRAWNRIADVINKALQSKVGKTLGLSKYSVPKLATGGMLDGKGQLFIAREKGPELVTSYGNKSAVMNNNQIVESVSGGVEIAVRNANVEQIALLRQQNELLYEILQKETGISPNDIFNSVRKSNNDYKAINGHSAFA